MSRELTEVKGIGPASVSLLEAVGYTSITDLASADVEKLHAEMTEANGLLEICKTVPHQKNIGRWVETAQEMLTPEEMEEAYFGGEEDSYVVEKKGDAVSVLVAIPVNAREMVEQKIKVSMMCLSPR